MKICFLTTNLFSIGGMERITTVFANELSKENEVTIIMPYSLRDKEKNVFHMSDKINLVNSYIFNGKSRNIVFRIIFKIILAINKRSGFLNNRIFFRVAEKMLYSKNYKQIYIDIINQYKFDVVIGVAYIYTLLLSLITEKIDTKTIGWQHSTFDGYFRYLGRLGFGLEYLYKKNMHKLDEVLVLTKSDKEKFDKYMNIDSKTLYNPLTFRIDRKSKLDNKVLLYVGRISVKTKGLDYLVKIMKRITKLDSEWILYVVGGGKDEKILADLIKRNHLEKNMIMVGKSSNVTKYYQDASIFLSTSRWEGFGLVITEAMESGLPVVSFKNNGPDEIIEDGVEGFLINQFDLDSFVDKVYLLMKDEHLRKTMSQNAMKRADFFKLENIMKQWNKILNSSFSYIEE